MSPGCSYQFDVNSEAVGFAAEEFGVLRGDYVVVETVYHQEGGAASSVSLTTGLASYLTLSMLAPNACDV